jgi:hypothetical protein
VDNCVNESLIGFCCNLTGDDCVGDDGCIGIEDCKWFVVVSFVGFDIRRKGLCFLGCGSPYIEKSRTVISIYVKYSIQLW